MPAPSGSSATFGAFYGASANAASFCTNKTTRNVVGFGGIAARRIAAISKATRSARESSSGAADGSAPSHRLADMVHVRMRSPTLYTLGPSHFSERARWGLDHVGYGYDEHRLALGPHAVFLRAKGLPATTLPVLAVGDTMIQGSGPILDHVGWPATDVALETRFESEIGPLVRRFIYGAALSVPDSGILDVLLEGVSAPEAVAGRIAWPALKLMIQRGMANPAQVMEVREALDRQLTWFDDHVRDEDGTRDTFGRTQMTAASLLSPLAGATPAPTRQRPIYPPEVQELLQTWRARPSLVWVRAVYAAHRTSRQ